jgi:hypothetical protein
LEYITKNNDSIQVLLGENGDSRFQKRFFSIKAERIWEVQELRGKNAPDKETLKCYALFVTGGFLVLIQDWLKNGMAVPVPEMAKIVANLVRDALGRTVGA